MLRTSPGDIDDWNACSFANFVFAPWCATSHESAQLCWPFSADQNPILGWASFPPGSWVETSTFPWHVSIHFAQQVSSALLAHASSSVFAQRDLSLWHILTFPSWLSPITLTLGIYRNIIFIGLLKYPSLAERWSQVLHQYDAEWEDFINCIYKKIQFAVVLSLLDGVAWIPGWYP